MIIWQVVHDWEPGIEGSGKMSVFCPTREIAVRVRKEIIKDSKEGRGPTKSRLRLSDVDLVKHDISDEGGKKAMACRAMALLQLDDIAILR